MTLKLIGAGYGRMGTRATKDALEMIGFGPCHHMAEVFAHQETVALWSAALDNPPLTAEGWEPLLGAYRSCVDWPSCYFWGELSEAYPDAKVLLSTRDPEKWWASIDKTIFTLLRNDVPAEANEVQTAHHAMMVDMIIKNTFDGNIDDKGHVLATLKRHEEEVRDTIPAERLLVWSVTEGWDPLCAFLDVPVPATDFPNRNTTREFREALRLES